jgi:hypothetical protein
MISNIGMLMLRFCHTVNLIIKNYGVICCVGLFCHVFDLIRPCGNLHDLDDPTCKHVPKIVHVLIMMARILGGQEYMPIHRVID